MNVQDVKKCLKDYKNGTYVKIKYKSVIPVIKDCNLDIKRITTMTARLGIDYGNLDSVKNRTTEPRKHTSNMFNFYKNILCTNINTKKDYLNVFTSKNDSKAIKTYYVNGVETKDIEQYKQYFKNANKVSKPTEFMRICLDNIISIGE